MSRRTPDEPHIIVLLANSQRIVKSPMESCGLDYYKSLYLDHHYTQIKIERLEQIINKADADLIFNEEIGHDGSHITEEECRYTKAKAEKELNEEVSKAEKLEAEMTKLQSSPLIQNVIARERKWYL